MEKNKIYASHAIYKVEISARFGKQKSIVLHCRLSL